MPRLVYTLRVCTLGSVPGPIPTARPTKHFDPSLLACQESVGKMSPVRLLLVNVLLWAPISAFAHRLHSVSPLPRSPGPRFLSLGSACCPTWGPRSLPRVPGPRRRGSPPPGVFVPLLFYRHNSFQALWFSCPRRAPWPPGPAASRGWAPAPDTARLSLCSRLSIWPCQPGRDRRARRQVGARGSPPADCLLYGAATKFPSPLIPRS